MLLVHPPFSLPSEPPAGIGYLAGALNAHGLPNTLWDSNIESIYWLLREGDDRCCSSGYGLSCSQDDLLADLQRDKLYKSISSYSSNVSSLNDYLRRKGDECGVFISLNEYRDTNLSPLKSEDIAYAAEHPEINIFFPYWSKRIPLLLEIVSPSMVGVSVNTFHQVLCAAAIIGLIRKLSSDLPIIVGGSMITTWSQNGTLRDNFLPEYISEIIVGAGEERLLKIHGVEPTDIKSRYTPDYHQLLDREYLSPGLILPYSASRGCYYRKCSFCPETTEENPYIHFSSETVLNELRSLCSEYDPQLIHIVDSAISPSTLNGFIDAPPGSPWYSFSRVEDLYMDFDFCVELKRAGCNMLQLGVESGSQFILDRLHKGIKIDMVEKALANLHKAGIATYVYLLFGTIDETIEDARVTLEFVRKNHEAITYLNLAKFNLPAHSVEAQRVKTYNNAMDGDLSVYTYFEHPAGWNRDRVREFLNHEFVKDIHVTAILKRTPACFGSSHAPFFNMSLTRDQT